MKSALKLTILCACASLVSLSMSASMTGTGTTPSPNKKEKLVVILLDGFRWDYVDMFKDKEALPGFRKLHKEGVRGKLLNLKYNFREKQLIDDVLVY